MSAVFVRPVARRLSLVVVVWWLLYTALRTLTARVLDRFVLPLFAWAKLVRQRVLVEKQQLH